MLVLGREGDPEVKHPTCQNRWFFAGKPGFVSYQC